MLLSRREKLPTLPETEEDADTTSPVPSKPKGAAPRRLRRQRKPLGPLIHRRLERRWGQKRCKSHRIFVTLLDPFGIDWAMRPLPFLIADDCYEKFDVMQQVLIMRNFVMLYLLQTIISPPKGTFEDDFPFSKVGYFLVPSRI